MSRSRRSFLKNTGAGAACALAEESDDVLKERIKQLSVELTRRGSAPKTDDDGPILPPPKRKEPEKDFPCDFQVFSHVLLKPSQEYFAEQEYFEYPLSVDDWKILLFPNKLVHFA